MYLTSLDIDAAAINSALMERQDTLQDKLITQESARFSNGTICVLGDRGPEPLDVYSGNDPSDWIENLAGWLLECRYPTLPIETEGFSNPICENDIAGLISAIFKQADSDQDLLTNFGPALGLSQDHSSGIYDPSDCTISPIIREFTGKRAIGFRYLRQHLAFDLGRTAQLASLFTVLFINHETPEYQLQLSHDSALFMANGSQLLGTRLTSNLIPLLGWNKGLADNVVTIGLASPPSFSDARHNLSLLCPELTAFRDSESEKGFPRSMDSAGEMVVTSSHVMNLLQQNELGSGETNETGHLSWGTCKTPQNNQQRLCQGLHRDSDYFCSAASSC